MWRTWQGLRLSPLMTVRENHLSCKITANGTQRGPLISQFLVVIKFIYTRMSNILPEMSNSSQQPWGCVVSWIIYRQSNWPPQVKWLTWDNESVAQCELKPSGTYTSSRFLTEDALMAFHPKTPMLTQSLQSTFDSNSHWNKKQP